MTMWRDGTWRLLVTVMSGDASSQPMDLTGYSASMNIRTAPGVAPFYTLSTDNGQITLGGTNGTIDLYIPAADTVSQFQRGTSGVYELDVTASGGTGDTDPILWGPFRVQGVA